MNRVVKGAASGVSKRLLLTRVRSALANPKFSFPEDWNLRKSQCTRMAVFAPK